MYKARNGFILHDTSTPAGYEIITPQDIITALECRPELETVAECFIFDALAQAINDRKEYANIDDLAQHLAANYL